jgi:hypothetical protein
VVPPDGASAVSNPLSLKESAKKLPFHSVERYFLRMKPRRLPISVLEGVRRSLSFSVSLMACNLVAGLAYLSILKVTL